MSNRLPHVSALLAALVLAAVPACASLTAEQQAALAKVQFITTDPAHNCQNLGVVSGSRDGTGAGSARGKAVILGANTLRGDGSAMTAFYCPPDPNAEPSP